MTGHVPLSPISREMRMVDMGRSIKYPGESLEVWTRELSASRSGYHSSTLASYFIKHVRVGTDGSEVSCLGTSAYMP